MIHFFQKPQISLYPALDERELVVLIVVNSMMFVVKNPVGSVVADWVLVVTAPDVDDYGHTDLALLLPV